MKLIKTFFNTIVIVFLILSCSYNSFEDKISEDIICSEVTYSINISAIISTSCAISGCHNGSQFPDLRSISSVQANASGIKARTQNRSMPKVGSLTQKEIDQIACWVDNGALNN